MAAVVAEKEWDEVGEAIHGRHPRDRRMEGSWGEIRSRIRREVEVVSTTLPAADEARVESLDPSSRKPVQTFEL